eukprot:1551710-Lingulodinium_polyedra.AAC.1
MLAGTPALARPRSSGCSRSTAVRKGGAAAMISSAKRTRLLPWSMRLRSRGSSHGNPQGCCR